MKTHLSPRWNNALSLLLAVVFLRWVGLSATHAGDTPAEPHSAKDLSSTNTVVIAGTVTSEDGGAVKGAVVRAINEKGEEVGKAISDASGSYTISALSTGRHWVEVLCGDFAYSGKVKDCQGSVTTDFVLVHGKDVKGVVLDQFGSPLCGVKARAETVRPLFLRADREPSRVTVAEATSDAKGCFVFRHLDDGVYWALGRADGYGQMGRGGQIFGVNRLGCTDRVGIILLPAVTIKGRVTDASGKPVENAAVFFMPSGERRLVSPGRWMEEEEQATSDADGRYIYQEFPQKWRGWCCNLLVAGQKPKLASGKVRFRAEKWGNFLMKKETS